MATGQADIDINGSADDVWAVVGDFGTIDQWMPGLDSCRVVGEDRIIGAGGRSITERLVSKDDARRQLIYSVTDGVPVDSHKATITVTPNGETTHVTWAVESTPDGMNDVMVTTYGGALKALKSKMEG
jgi:hypothetical protein